MLKPYLVALAVVAAMVVVGLIELGMGREPMCTCGFIALWHGAVDSQNSQHISDWYTFTHVEHGIGFYALLTVLAKRLPPGVRLLAAVLVEGAWEVAENTPFIIDRYRTATVSLDYYGDSVVNSLADIVAMLAGYWLAARLPVRVTIALVIATEVLLALVIRDNLALNILMLLYPLDIVRQWQMSG